MDNDDPIQCPECNSHQIVGECFMGTLGNQDHFRCRYCGAQWHQAVPPILKPGDVVRGVATYVKPDDE